MGTYAEILKSMKRKQVIGKLIRVTGDILLVYSVVKAKQEVDKQKKNPLTYKSDKAEDTKLAITTIAGVACYVIGSHLVISANRAVANAGCTEIKALTDQLSYSEVTYNDIAKIADKRAEMAQYTYGLASLDMNKEHYKEFARNVTDMAATCGADEAKMYFKPESFERARDFGNEILDYIKEVK